MDRKQAHIDLALQQNYQELLVHDDRFDYEPLLSSHPDSKDSLQTVFVGKKVSFPLWISSMTGGTERAYRINSHLAQAAKEFGLGMGLGSCRPLLEGRSRLVDFDWRAVIGNDLPFWANLGIAQIESSLLKGEIQEIRDLVSCLKTDGLIIHINPLQEWLQAEGDRLTQAPLETLKQFLPLVDFPVMVKEVGQGMGPRSLWALLHLPVAAIELAAFGGTNFSAIELARQKNSQLKRGENPLIHIGHTASQMVDDLKKYLSISKQGNQKPDLILSGGVRNFLDGHYLRNRLGYPCLYGQGKAILERANCSYVALQSYLKAEISGLFFANCFLKVKDSK